MCKSRCDIRTISSAILKQVEGSIVNDENSSSKLKRQESYYGMNFVFLIRGQMSMTTPELTPASPNFRTFPAGGYRPSTSDLPYTTYTPIVRSLVEWASDLKISCGEARTIPQGYEGASI
ncbi:hypothetical protein AVEN_174742-1 [Araneus ventricosus]|uniref:Uncharacterized protein n=1 Tax=Araneus ventricosus TaxID=182803 RepID=A0A4Y2BJM7_ARAVE|nr:hypothetical protein AVEN_174742-1 [Araneus ventricosus]